MMADAIVNQIFSYVGWSFLPNVSIVPHHTSPTRLLAGDMEALLLVHLILCVPRSVPTLAS